MLPFEAWVHIFMPTIICVTLVGIIGGLVYLHLEQEAKALAQAQEEAKVQSVTWCRGRVCFPAHI